MLQAGVYPFSMLLRIILFFFFVSLNFLSYSQKHDNVWVVGLGFEENPNDSIWGKSLIDFSTTPPSTIYNGWEGMRFSETNASICDREGNLLFYSNGIYIADKNNDPMPGGDGLNPGEIADEFGGSGYIADQGALVLPHPTDSTLFYLIHSNLEYPTNDLSVHTSRIYYTLVDMKLNSGLGAVVEKNVEIVVDTLGPGKLSSVKHANGRDWWILAFEYDSDYYYKILLGTDGFSIEKVGISEIILRGKGGCVFSPDGEKYIRYSVHNISTGNYLYINSFDRCSGDLQVIEVDTIIDEAYFGGVAVSANSRYLYVSSHSYLYQYDLEALNISATKDTVAIYDGYTSIQPTFFQFPQLAPDDKIYISCFGTTNVFHVIEEPDLPGEACQVNQHSFQLPTYRILTMVNFPNYRLGALEGSPCDTLGVSTTTIPQKAPSLYLYPNPTDGLLNLEWQAARPDNIKVHDLMGRLVYKRSVPMTAESTLRIDLGHLASGVYLVSAWENGGMALQKKVVVNR